jgi:hypothetical protein
VRQDAKAVGQGFRSVFPSIKTVISWLAWMKLKIVFISVGLHIGPICDPRGRAYGYSCISASATSAWAWSRKIPGEIHRQGWDFHAVTFCLFLVFALPGFICRHDLRNYIDRARNRAH